MPGCNGVIRFSEMSSVVRSLLAAAAVAVGFALLTSAAAGRESLTLTLNVTYSATGEVAVTTPDGSPVGTSSGAPTVIPAGFYTLSFSQPGCSELPFFDLQGPGVNIMDNMLGGEETRETDDAVFLPNSTYTWTDEADPSVVYTFTTSPDVVGTPPPAVSGSAASAALSSLASSEGLGGGTVSNVGVVGSSLSSSRAPLAATVTSAGVLSLTSQGRPITRLAAGRYTITILDSSKTAGFVLEHAGHAAVTVSAGPLVGKRSLSIELTAGRWLYGTTPRGLAHALIVS